jgi:hypothetical protein
MGPSIAGSPPGQRDDQPQVGSYQVVLGLPAVFGDPLKIDAAPLPRQSPESGSSFDAFLQVRGCR